MHICPPLVDMPRRPRTRSGDSSYGQTRPNRIVRDEARMVQKLSRPVRSQNRYTPESLSLSLPALNRSTGDGSPIANEDSVSY